MEVKAELKLEEITIFVNLRLSVVSKSYMDHNNMV